MPNEIEVRCYPGGTRYDTESFTFPGGELQVKLPRAKELKGVDIEVLARLQSAEDLFRLDFLVEILDRVKTGTRTLIVPYFPGARQDRVTQFDTAFSLKRYAKFINNLGFDRVIVADPHSDVTPALVENIEVVSQTTAIKSHGELFAGLRMGRMLIVAPDAGSSKKAAAVAAVYKATLVQASKIRDVATGELTDTEIANPELVKDREVLIVDDIVDGGRTFIELAKVLRTAGASKVFLFVTHGILSKDLSVFEGFLDGIYTTDTFLSPFVGDARPVPLTVSKLDLSNSGTCR